MLENHPIANLFPLIEGEDFSRLVADIYEHGLQEKIVLREGKILDGRNRYRALVSLDRFDQFRDTIDFDHLAFTHGAPKDPLVWVLSKNLHRRHLSESQRAMVAAKLATLEPGRPSLWKKPADLPGSSHVEHADVSSGLTQAEAAETMHVSERSVRSARKVIEQGDDELVAAVERGEIAVSRAEGLAGLPKDQQKELIRSADPAALYAIIKENKAKTTAEKKLRRENREAELAGRQRALPDKRYGVIYADPEWKFEPYSRDTGMDRAADNHYPTSELADIKARDVAAIAAEDCVLFLWATAPMLPQALDVMAAWGYAYKSHTIWRKAGDDGLMLGTGYWFRNGHELLLVGTRGKAVAPAMGEQFPSVIDHPALRHSEKPGRFAEMIEAYFPNLPKIELNARATRPGWDAWGLEAPEQETESEAAHDGSSSGLEARPADESASPEADASLSASGPTDINAIIAEGYARDSSITELMALTGLGRSAVKMRAKRLGLSDPERQRQAARQNMTKLNAERGGAA
jgi:N6-adenosine-specific RNA methylase IME4